MAMDKARDSEIFDTIVKNYQDDDAVTTPASPKVTWLSAGGHGRIWNQNIDDLVADQLRRKTGSAWLDMPQSLSKAPRRMPLYFDLQHFDSTHKPQVEIVASPVAGTSDSAADDVPLRTEGRRSTNGMTGFSSFYRSMWVLIALLSLTWGVALGFSVAGEGLWGPSTYVTGSVLVVGLIATLFIAGRKRQLV